MTDTEADFDLAAVFGVLLQIGSTMERLNRRIDAIEKREKQWAELAPRPLRVRKSGVYPTTSGQTLVLGLPGPRLQRQREYRQLIVGGATWGTSAAGTANVYVSPSNPDVLGEGAEALWAQVDEAASLPSVAFYSSGQMVVNYGFDIYVEIINGTAGQVYAVAGFCWDVPEGLWRPEPTVL